jgi:hypothetical protein
LETTYDEIIANMVKYGIFNNPTELIPINLVETKLKKKLAMKHPKILRYKVPLTHDDDDMSSSTATAFIPEPDGISSSTAKAFIPEPDGKKMSIDTRELLDEATYDDISSSTAKAFTRATADDELLSDKKGGRKTKKRRNTRRKNARRSNTRRKNARRRNTRRR